MDYSVLIEKKDGKDVPETLFGFSGKKERHKKRQCSYVFNVYLSEMENHFLVIVKQM